MLCRESDCLFRIIATRVGIADKFHFVIFHDRESIIGNDRERISVGVRTGECHTGVNIRLVPVFVILICVGGTGIGTVNSPVFRRAIEYAPVDKCRVRIQHPDVAKSR